MTVNSDISTNSRSKIFLTIFCKIEAAGLNGPGRRREEVGVGMDVDEPDGKFAAEAETVAAKRSRPDEAVVNMGRVYKAVVAVEVIRRWPTNRGGEGMRREGNE